MKELDANMTLQGARRGRKHFLRRPTFGASLTVVLFLLSQASLSQVSRYFSVRDSIEMSTFARDPLAEEDATFSPDGRYFFVVVRRGLLRSNETESIIWVFDAAKVKSSIEKSQRVLNLHPRPVVRIAATSNDDNLIADARWATDGRSIAFLGRDKNSVRHLFVVDTADGKLRQLTSNGQDVANFDRVNDTFIYTAAKPVISSHVYDTDGPALPDIQVGTGLSLFGLLYPHFERSIWGEQTKQVWQVRGGKVSPVLEAGTSLPLSLDSSPFASVLSLSPSGRYVVTTKYVEHVPKSWESYESAYESNFTRIVSDDSSGSSTAGYSRPGQYVLIDLKSGAISPLVDAPLGSTAGYGDFIKVAWSPDEREVALLNTFLPLDSPLDNGQTRVTHPCVAVVEIATRKARCVKESHPIALGKVSTSLPLSEIEWHGSDQQLVLRYYGNGLPPEVFRRESANWKQVDDPVAKKMPPRELSRGGLSIAVHQSLNAPPVLIATDSVTGESRAIWDPNPKLAGINLGEATIYHWRDQAGYEWTGGLVKPPNYVASHRYPLVIQTHGFNANEFLADGIYATANAARPLAGRGIVVLQVEEPTNHMGTPLEPEADGRDGYISAIEQLGADGLVDTTKVGIIGFSHTGWYVLESLIHSPKYFLAATLAECSYESFGEYLMNADYFGPERAKSIAAGIGSEPFGKGLQKWLTASPGFNTDKISAPILFEENSPPAMIYSWDIYAALRLQRKPVELLYIRNGSHILAKPLERLASQEMNVDWYDFWLNGRENSDPGKLEQYVRWRELRKEYETARHGNLSQIILRDEISRPPRRPGK